MRRNKRPVEENFDTLAEGLLRTLGGQPAIGQLATNPLLCGVICALHRERTELPDTQVELCEDLCKMLLHRREKEVGLDTVALSRCYSQLNYEQKRGVAQELAHYMVRNGQSSVTIQEADNCFAEALRRFPNKLADSAGEIRQGFLERSGLLREPQPDRLDFVHNTLKEYLAGERFAQLGDTGPLVEHALDPAWQPSILFAAGSRVVGFADRLIQRLLDDGGMVGKVSRIVGWSADVERARKVFAVRCGGSALYLSEKNRDILNEILQRASRPETPTESSAFAALGEFVVPLLGYESQLCAKTAVACIRALRMIDSESARDQLAGYAADTRKSVVAEYREATDLVNSIGVRLRLIPAGEFQMGPDQTDHDRPIHGVRITQPFVLGTFPVTQSEYESVMDGATPSHFKGDPKRPVEEVSWWDAVEFCNRLSAMEEREPFYHLEGDQVVLLGGDGYRLPTEAEWEYACRAGSTGEWCFGNDEKELTRFAWFSDNAKGKPHPVGQKEPNAWGLHDTHGNVWEWCWDWYGPYAGVQRVDDPTGPPNGCERVIRGGGWAYGAEGCGSAFRIRDSPCKRDVDLGFRVSAVPSGGAGKRPGKAEPRA